MTDRYLIWSDEHSAWWRPASRGYTIHMDQAGRYSREEALSICANGRDGWNAKESPSEIPVREEDAIACRDLDKASRPDPNKHLCAST